MHASTYPNGAAQAASIGSPYSKHLTANIRASGLARLAAGIVISDGDVLWRLLLDLQKEVSVGNVEIVGRVERRRKWTPEEKAGQFPLVGGRRPAITPPRAARSTGPRPGASTRRRRRSGCPCGRGRPRARRAARTARGRPGSAHRS